MKRITPILLVLVATLFVLHTARYWNSLLDDAYISIRYSESLAEGRGLVFNPDERVEGYTNFSWVLLGAGALVLGIDPATALQATSRLAAISLLFALFRLQRVSDPDAKIPALLWILPLEAFGYWTSTAMETMLFATLFVAGLDLALREAQDGRFRGVAFVWTLLAMTRPEGVLACGLGLLGSFFVERIRRGVWPWRRSFLNGGIFSLLFGGYFLVRWNYFGEMLPNTFHAKVTGGREQWINGFINLGQWARTYPLFALALIVFTVWIARERRFVRRPELLVVAGTTIVWISYVVSVGGDFMPFLRFFLPVLPLCAVVLSTLLSSFSVQTGIVVAALALHFAATLPSEEPYRAYVAHRTTTVGEVVGEYFRERYEKDDPAAWLAVNTAGSLPYASKLPTIDMLGLTDKAIARHPVYIVSPLWAGHRRGWGEYVLSRRPRAIVWYNSAGLPDPHYLGDHQLADLPYFRFFYQMRRETLESPEPDGTVLERFLGAPFGETSARSPELGTLFEVVDNPVTYTRAKAAPITLHYFELRSDRESLWDLSIASDNVGVFLDRVVQRWHTEIATRPPADPEARTRVEGLCDLALARIEAGDRETAKNLLSRAAAQNGAAQSPRVFQYVTNLAVLEKDLFLAVHAQQEALRLDPGNELFRRNLQNLLTAPWKQFKGEDRGE